MATTSSSGGNVSSTPTVTYLWPDNLLKSHRKVINERRDLISPEQIECHECGNTYAQIGMHWSRGSCSWPSLTETQWEILVGSLLGDGHACESGGMTVEMINPTYIEFLHTQFPLLSTESYLSREAETLAWYADHYDFHGDEEWPTVNVENFHDAYKLRFRSHPDIDLLRSWYDSGEKVFPSNMQMTPTIAKHFYVGDGTFSGRSCSISSSNERNRSHVLEEMFYRVGFTPTFSGNTLRFSVAESQRLLEWMGRSPPGFEYKWETDPVRYTYLKDMTYGDL